MRKEMRLLQCSLHLTALCVRPSKEVRIASVCLLCMSDTASDLNNQAVFQAQYMPVCCALQPPCNFINKQGKITSVKLSIITRCFFTVQQ
jgi:hypothetical protein